MVSAASVAVFTSAASVAVFVTAASVGASSFVAAAAGVALLVVLGLFLAFTSAKKKCLKRSYISFNINTVENDKLHLKLLKKA